MPFNYLAITEPTATWLLDHSEIITALSTVLSSDEVDSFFAGSFAERSLTVAGTSDGLLLAVWHGDYLGGTGEETWGFLRFDQDFGLREMPLIFRAVLERGLSVISQRLRGLLIDQNWFFRNHDNGTYTITAGGGEDARRQNIAYTDAEVLTASNGRARSVLIVGPGHSFETLSRLAYDESKKLSGLIHTANRLLTSDRRRPALDSQKLAELRTALQPNVHVSEPGYEDVGVSVSPIQQSRQDAARVTSFSYDEWYRSRLLTDTQRKILDSDIIRRFPLRIVGPAGSGKTLLMQLLAMRRLRSATQEGSSARVLYVTHNAAMAENAIARFEILGAEQFLYQLSASSLHVETLAGYAKRELQLSERLVIDVDAYQTKLFQFDVVRTALRESLSDCRTLVDNSKLLQQVGSSAEVAEVFSHVVMAEISIAIKGHQLVNDEKRYVESETRLSRLHGALNHDERRFIFDVFRRYHRYVFEEARVLDSDDLAISLYGTLRTPIWELRRRTLGFDHVFIDETQLFNENERRIFPLLTKGLSTHLPIVVALDEAQESFGQTSAGFGALGIADIQDEELNVSQRSTKAIIDLSFFVVERTKHLLEASFPAYPGTAVSNDNPLARFPSIERYRGDTSYPKFVLKRIRELRKENLWQIAVVCHADSYWKSLEEELTSSNLPVHVLLQRGDRLTLDQPLVVLSRPAYVGGQEFDAVIAVGLEEGLVPPKIVDNDGLAFAVEQQAWREMYVSFTRARYRVLITLPLNAKPSPILKEAVERKLLSDVGTEVLGL